jgi:hypothetical protein
MTSPEIIEAFWPTNLFEKGIGWVIIARIKARGKKAVVEIFLVDVWCLGVKQTFHEVCDPEDYRQRIRNYYLSEYPMEQIPPARARSLVEQAVQYAMALGLPPAAGYEKASRVFAQIPASANTEHFTFGSKGKPFYISGPNETYAVARRIVEHLALRCGVGNFDYIAEVPASQVIHLYDKP